MKTNRGRPPKLTKELCDKICSALRAGNYRDTAAAYAGISKNTLYEWLRRGAREPHGIYHEFSEAVEKALADSETAAVALIRQAASGGKWQASAWLLEPSPSRKMGMQQSHQHRNSQREGNGK